MQAAEVLPSDPLDELDELVLACEAHKDPALGRIYATPGAGTAAAKQRHANGLAEAGAALVINKRLYLHRRKTIAHHLTANR
jgi:hypothetical protein